MLEPSSSPSSTTLAPVLPFRPTPSTPTSPSLEPSPSPTLTNYSILLCPFPTSTTGALSSLRPVPPNMTPHCSEPFAASIAATPLLHLIPTPSPTTHLSEPRPSPTPTTSAPLLPIMLTPYSLFRALSSFLFSRFFSLASCTPCEMSFSNFNHRCPFAPLDTYSTYSNPSFL